MSKVTARDAENYIRASGKLVNEQNLGIVCRMVSGDRQGERGSMLDSCAYAPFYKNNPGMIDVISEFQRLHPHEES